MDFLHDKHNKQLSLLDKNDSLVFGEPSQW